MKKYILIIFISLAFVSCTQQYYNYGWVKFFEKDYENADKIFRKILAGNPNDARNLKGLGVTQFMMKNYDEAFAQLEKSYSINKEDPETVLNLGLVYEAQNKFDKAIEYYSRCIDMKPDSKIRSEVEKLLSNVKKTMYKAEVKSLIDGEKSISDKDITKGSAAIVPFYNRGEKGDYDVLQKGIPQMMITDFGYVPSINILERLRIEELIKEMKLSETNLVEKGTAQRLGKLLKAENIVSGSYAVSSTNAVKIDVFVINVRTSQISDIVEKTGAIEDFFNVQKDISLAALDKMGVRVTDDQRRRIKTLPTETFFEFLAALKKKTAEEEEFVFQGADFLNNLMVTFDVPVNEVSTVTTSPEVKATINPVETPLPRPPATPK